jgi:hypothetical protein
MFASADEPLALLVELRPKHAKRRFRDEIYNSWNHCCGYCGKEATSLDHIIPRFKSGSSNRNNLLPACRRCNANKGSADMECWYKQQEFFTEERLCRIQKWMEPEILVLPDLLLLCDSA